MASDDFPDEFEIIILGTGLTETIASAAFSRIGLKVLHIDRNNFYGGNFGNFSLEGIEKWMEENQARAKLTGGITEETEAVKSLLCEGERLVSLPTSAVGALSISSQFHVRERTAKEEAEAQERKKKSRFFPSFIPTPVEPEIETDSQTEAQTSPSTEAENTTKDTEELSADSAVSEGTESVSASDLPPEQGVSEKSPSASDSGISESQLEGVSNGMTESNSEQITDGSSVGMTESNNEGASQTKSEGASKLTESNEGKSESTESSSDGQKSEEVGKKEVTAGDIKDETRRFCFDLSPKIVHCCGEMVEILIQSDVARYCEFRTVSRVLTMLKGQLQEVPCSRADVFSSKIVSLIEKRLMMKFLQFAVDYENHPEEYKEFEDKPFREFLQSKKLTTNIQHFVQHAIAMVSDTATTKEGLAKTLKFLQSLGRYGNTAFLFPLYGTGELPQAFSRMSAVFGGTFCLSMTASHLVVDAENKCTGIVTSQGKKIRSKYVIAESSYLPASFYNVVSDRKLARAIYITDQSVCPSQDAELSLLNYVCKSDPDRPVTVLELPPSAAVCLKPFFVVHLSRGCVGEDPEVEFQEIREELFNASHKENDDTPTSKPRILWSMYFLLNDLSQIDTTSNTPGNVLVTSGGGDPGVDMDECVQEARQIFKTVCPDEEFLPKPPNPEDIIHVDDAEAPVSEGPSEFEGQDGQKEEKEEEQKTEAPTDGEKEEEEASEQEKDGERESTVENKEEE